MGATEIMGSLFGVGKVSGHSRVTLLVLEVNLKAVLEAVIEVRTSPFFLGTNRFFRIASSKFWVKVLGKSSG